MLKKDISYTLSEWKKCKRKSSMYISKIILLIFYFLKYFYNIIGSNREIRNTIDKKFHFSFSVDIHGFHSFK